jgi:hypothetical protein
MFLLEELQEPYDWLVGRQLEDGRWVKAKLRAAPKEREYLCVKGEGFKLHQSYASAAELRKVISF